MLSNKNIKHKPSCAIEKIQKEQRKLDIPFNFIFDDLQISSQFLMLRLLYKTAL